jgi:hypothetical protein
VRRREAEPEHRAALDERDQPGRLAHPQEGAQPELQPEREHHENDAEFRQRPDHRRVGHERHGDVRADEHSGDEIAEHHRLAQSLEEQARRRGHAQHQREVLEELGSVVHQGFMRRAVALRRGAFGR